MTSFCLSVCLLITIMLSIGNPLHIDIILFLFLFANVSFSLLSFLFHDLSTSSTLSSLLFILSFLSSLLILYSLSFSFFPDPLASSPILSPSTSFHPNFSSLPIPVPSLSLCFCFFPPVFPYSPFSFRFSSSHRFPSLSFSLFPPPFPFLSPF